MLYYIRAKVKDGERVYLHATRSQGDMYSEDPKQRMIKTVTWVRERDIPNFNLALKEEDLDGIEEYGIWTFYIHRHRVFELTVHNTAIALKWSYVNKEIHFEEIKKEIKDENRR